MATMAMFPLGTVLVPSAYLPLHVFEPRYRALVQTCLAGDREFGVVLIERGSEVGGGDQRTDVGTVARIVEATELPDGRWAIGTVGIRRIRINEWLDDDPYPRADVDDWADEDDDVAPSDLAATRDLVVTRLRRLLAARAELGEAVAAATIELSDDPVLASYQAVAVAPIGPADQHALLGERGAAARYARLELLLAEEEDVAARRLALGDGPS